MTSTINVKRPFGLLQIVRWGLSHSIKQGKIGDSDFFAATMVFFQKIVFLLVS